MKVLLDLLLVLLEVAFVAPISEPEMRVLLLEVVHLSQSIP